MAQNYDLYMQLLSFLIIYPFFWLVSILPFRILYMISDFAFLLLYYVFGYRKKVVIANLKLVFPEKSNAEIMKICKAFYKHLADMILEAVKSMTISESEMMKRFKFKNLDIIHNFEKEKRSTCSED